MSSYNYTGINEENIIYYPSDFKLNVAMDAIDGYHMEDVDFTCSFYVSSTFVSNKKVVTLEKSQMIKVDANNYVAPLSSENIGRGELMVKYKCDVPDNDFGGGIRHEVIIVSTNLRIM